MHINTEWYEIKLIGDVAEIMIFDEIGKGDLAAGPFIKHLQGLDVKRIDLIIHSPGGSVFDGAAIMSALKQHPARIEAHILGLAASMAASIPMQLVYTAETSGSCGRWPTFWKRLTRSR